MSLRPWFRKASKRSFQCQEDLGKGQKDLMKAEGYTKNSLESCLRKFLENSYWLYVIIETTINISNIYVYIHLPGRKIPWFKEIFPGEDYPLHSECDISFNFLKYEKLDCIILGSEGLHSHPGFKILNINKFLMYKTNIQILQKECGL